jgi:hypothetical protein
MRTRLSNDPTTVYGYDSLRRKVLVLFWAAMREMSNV